MPGKIKIEKADESKLRDINVKNWTPWSCPPSVFDWEYDSNETAYVREGRVIVRTDEGDDVEIKAGDIVTFPNGMKCTWEVKETIRKVFMFH